MQKWPTAKSSYAGNVVILSDELDRNNRYRGGGVDHLSIRASSMENHQAAQGKRPQLDHVYHDVYGPILLGDTLTGY